MVKIFLSDDQTGDLQYSLAKLKKIFYQKKSKFCRLDLQFIYWDLKLKKYREQCQNGLDDEIKINPAIYEKTKEFLENMKLEFNSNWKTFDIVK